MNVAVVSNLTFQRQIELMLKNFEKLNKIEIKKTFFSNEKNFLLQLKKINFDLIILFHSAENPSIFNITSKIKDIKPKSEIIFSSNSSEFAVSGYKVGISFYLIYPFSFDDFNFAIKKCLKNSIEKSKYIIISSNWQKIPLKINEIQFAEKIGHNVVIHTENKTISTRITFTEFVKKFENSPNFINCVRGALVNLVWVEKLESQNFLLKSGERISIRRKDRKKIKQIYSEFLISNKN